MGPWPHSGFIDGAPPSEFAYQPLRIGRWQQLILRFRYGQHDHPELSSPTEQVTERRPGFALKLSAQGFAFDAESLGELALNHAPFGKAAPHR